MKGKHPSGRPIRKPTKRDYSMQAHRYTGFRCPRLNEKRHDTHVFGFIDHRVGEWGFNEETPSECGMKGRKR